MNAMKFHLVLAAMLLSLSTVAQSPYSEWDEENPYTYEVNFSGQKPGIADFVTAWIGEPEDMLAGLMYDMWQKYLKHKPQDKNCKLTVDAKNGYVRFERFYPDDQEGFTPGSKIVIEMCYWNCSDNKYKIIAHSVSWFVGDEAELSDMSGIFFGIYNNAKRAFVTTNGCESLGMDDMVKYDQGGGREGYLPIVTYYLPRVGKDITAVIHNHPEGRKEIIIKWNGMKFEVQE